MYQNIHPIKDQNNLFKIEIKILRINAYISLRTVINNGAPSLQDTVPYTKKKHINDNDSEITLFGHKKSSEISNIVVIIIIVIMLVIDILGSPEILLVHCDAASIRP